MARYLTFQLYGMLAAYGLVAVGEVRLTGGHPTRSAIFGLLAACLGIRRGEEQRLRALSDGYGLAVRVDAPGTRLLDYHTVQTPPEKSKRVYRTRSDELGGLLDVDEEPYTVLSRRGYLCDAHFTACLRALSDAAPFGLEEIAAALRSPSLRPTSAANAARRPCPSLRALATPTARPQRWPPIRSMATSSAGSSGASAKKARTRSSSPMRRRPSRTSCSANGCATGRTITAGGSSSNGRRPWRRFRPDASATRRPAMYLSKLVLQPKKAIFKDIYDAHEALWRLFSDGPERKRDFLFREIDPVTYLAVSAREPVDADGIWRMAVKPYAPKLAAGDRLYISLRANAVVKRRGRDGRQQRFDVVQDARKPYTDRGEDPPPRALLAQQEGAKWLIARQEALGLCFEDQSLVVESYMVRQYWREERRARFGTLDFAGFAAVSDADKALGALCRGVGPAKGFGCGLLLARRA